MQDKIETVTAMLYQPDVYHLEVVRRGREVGAIGLIGSFGDRIISQPDTPHTDKRAILDKLQRNTNLIFDPSTSEAMRQIDEAEDETGDGLVAKSKVYELLLQPGTKVESSIDDISIETLDRQSIIMFDSKLTPVTRKFFRGYLDYGPEHN